MRVCRHCCLWHSWAKTRHSIGPCPWHGQARHLSRQLSFQQAEAARQCHTNAGRLSGWNLVVWPLTSRLVPRMGKTHVYGASKAARREGLPARTPCLHHLIGLLFGLVFHSTASSRPDKHHDYQPTVADALLPPTMPRWCLVTAGSPRNCRLKVLSTRTTARVYSERESISVYADKAFFRESQVSEDKLLSLVLPL